MPGFFLQQQALACLQILGNLHVQCLISVYPTFAQILGVILCWGRGGEEGEGEHNSIY